MLSDFYRFRYHRRTDKDVTS